MKRHLLIGLVGLVVLFSGIATVVAAGESAEKKSSKKVSPHRVAVCYFHRTKRCPTCIKIGTLVEKAIDKSFSKSCKKAAVELHLIDFQAEKNKAYAKSYNVKGPTLIILDIRDGKVKQWKTLPKIWTLVGKETEFKKYVQDEARAYADGKKNKP